MWKPGPVAYPMARRRRPPDRCRPTRRVAGVADAFAAVPRLRRRSRLQVGGWHVLGRQRGLLCFLCPLVTGTRGEPRPIVHRLRRELLRQAEQGGKQQGIADGDICRSEPARGVEATLQPPQTLAQAGEEPALVILRHLWQPTFRWLETPVAKHEGLREGQRRLAEVQAV